MPKPDNGQVIESTATDSAKRRGGRKINLAPPLRAGDVAEFLGVSLRWVYNHARELGGVRIGGTWFWTEANLAEALQGDNQDPYNSFRSRTQQRGPKINKRSRRVGAYFSEADLEAAERVGIADLLR